MSYSIRPASPDDIPHLVQHRELMFRAMETRSDFPAMASSFSRWLEEAVPSGTFRAWLIEEDERREVVAGGGLIVLPWPPGPTRFDPRMAYVFNVYTDPAHRGRGLARRVMEAMHEWCRDQGIERIALNASADGRPIYDSMGYELVEPQMRLQL